MYHRPQQSTPPPTSSSSTTTNTNELSDYFRFNSNNDPISSRPQLPLSALTKRLPKEGSVHRPAFPAATNPLNISSAVHSSSYNSRSRSSASPSPLSSAPRSPYLPSSRLNSPVLTPAALPRPVASRMSSYAVTTRSESSSNSGIQDVLAPGDIIGQGSLLEGEVVQLVSSCAPTAAHSASPSPDPEEPAREFEVVRRLGAGSYAVVYLVKEVLYRPPPSRSDDGHEIMDEEDFRRPSTVYGREYAIKCLSKADLDEEALEAQMAEVCCFLWTVCLFAHYDPRRRYINLFALMRTSSPCTELWKLLPSCFYYWNSSLAKICFTFWNRLVITTKLTLHPTLLHPTHRMFLAPLQRLVFSQH